MSSFQVQQYRSIHDTQGYKRIGTRVSYNLVAKDDTGLIGSSSTLNFKLFATFPQSNKTLGISKELKSLYLQ